MVSCTEFEINSLNRAGARNRKRSLMGNYQQVVAVERKYYRVLTGSNLLQDSSSLSDVEVLVDDLRSNIAECGPCNSCKQSIKKLVRDVSFFKNLERKARHQDKVRRLGRTVKVDGQCRWSPGTAFKENDR